MVMDYLLQSMGWATFWANFLQTYLVTLAGDRTYLRTYQGCQIFLGTKYQNGEKFTKLPQTVPNVHKI
jgi:hypothetical protein